MEKHSNFIRTIIETDLKTGKHKEIVTRFPPEPNGHLHIGHARAIVTDFESARLYGGRTNLRFDDTNPVKEDDTYVQAIINDVRWLGYEPDQILFASDYFDEMYERAIVLIKKGLAYIDDQTAEEIQATRGDLNTPGVESPYRNRSVEENLQLFEQMKACQFEEGTRVLRAKIDMASPNMNMRDPVVYRIVYASHHRTQDKWCIYPMYDYAHPLEDAIEEITHSLCSIEFEDHRPLYDWFVEMTEMPFVPRQIEFGRLNIENTVLSKRFLRQMVEEGKVKDWDDPRMPTLAGMRRRGYTPEAIRSFILSTGLSKANSTVSMSMLEAAVRDDLQEHAKRAMAVIHPLKVTITNYPKNEVEFLEAPYHPEDESLGVRQIPFSRHIYIERDDFVLEKPNKHYKRLALNLEVRLMNAYFIKATDVVYDDENNIVEVLATYDKETKSGTGFTGRKANGTIHFVEATQAVPATFNFFEPLVTGDESLPLLERINDDSWHRYQGFIEADLRQVKPQDKFQFIRNGYFNVDDDSSEDAIIFNEIVPLKSSYK
ncbi:MAG: glutamine--tRNA ligase/YqeY domain fusion protein [Acholeplasmataceae bacterium]|nr:glutamine--tRNA ligase/YqeY domain fusion protein [Acholeplasmataceae bacterium]